MSISAFIFLSLEAVKNSKNGISTVLIIRNTDCKLYNGYVYELAKTEKKINHIIVSISL